MSQNSNIYHTSLKAALPTLILLWGSVFISINVRTSIGTLSESMSAAFNILGYDLIRISSYIAIGSILTLLLSGHISYVLMHKRTLVLSLVLLIAGLIFVAISSTVVLLKIGFFIIGAGAGLYPGSGIPVANAMSSDAIRGKVIAIHETGSVGAFVFVPIFSSLVLTVGNWRMVLILFALMSFLLLLGIMWGCKEGNFRGKPLTFGNVFILTKKPMFWALSISFAVTGSANIFVYTSMADFLVRVRDFDSQTVALIQSLSRVSSVLIIFFSGIIMSRLPSLYIVFFTAFVAGVFTVLFGILLGVQLLPIVFLQSFMLSAFFPALFVTVGKYFPGNSQGLVIALMVLFSQIIGIIFNDLYSYFSELDYAGMSYIIVGISIGISGLLVLFCRKARPFIES